MINRLLQNQILILLCFFFPSILLSQQTIDSQSFFQKVIQSTPQTNSAAYDNLFNIEFKYPWLEQVQIRTETDQFEIDKQRYTIRLTPAQLKRHRLEKELFQQQVRRAQQEQSSQELALLPTAYRQWLNYNLLVKKIKTTEELLPYYEDLITVEKKKINTNTSNLTDWMEAQMQLKEVQFEIEKAELQQQTRLRDLQILYQAESLQINTTGFISIKKIRDLISNNNPIITFENDADLQAIELRQAQIAKEIQLEESESNAFFDYLQFRYRGPHEDELREKFSLGIGFEIQNPRMNQLKMNELTLEALEQSQNYLETKTELELEAQNAFQDVQDLLLEYDLVKKYITDTKEQLDNLSAIYFKQTKPSPADVLQLKIKEIELDLQQQDIEEEIYDAYLDWLSLTQKMIQMPLVNYLSEELNKL